MVAFFPLLLLSSAPRVLLLPFLVLFHQGGRRGRLALLLFLLLPGRGLVGPPLLRGTQQFGEGQGEALEEKEKPHTQCQFPLPQKKEVNSTMTYPGQSLPPVDKEETVKDESSGDDEDRQDGHGGHGPAERVRPGRVHVGGAAGQRLVAPPGVEQDHLGRDTHCHRSKFQTGPVCDAYCHDQGRQRQVEELQVHVGPVAGSEAEDGAEVPEEGLDAVDVAEDEQLHQCDEQVGPAGGVVVQEVDQVAPALNKAKMIY